MAPRSPAALGLGLAPLPSLRLSPRDPLPGPRQKSNLARLLKPQVGKQPREPGEGFEADLHNILLSSTAGGGPPRKGATSAAAVESPLFTARAMAPQSRSAATAPLAPPDGTRAAWVYDCCCFAVAPYRW